MLRDELSKYNAPPIEHPSIESLKPQAPQKGLFDRWFGKEDEGAKLFHVQTEWAKPSEGLISRMFKKKEEEKPKKEMPPDLPRGLYLFGDVGSGKTMLMDLFFETLPPNVASKTRIHFHNFMQDVHRRLHVLKMTHGGEFDAIPLVAADIAETGNVLCFDEFQCTDVADAMILRR